MMLVGSGDPAKVDNGALIKVDIIMTKMSLFKRIGFPYFKNDITNHRTRHCEHSEAMTRLAARIDVLN